MAATWARYRASSRAVLGLDMWTRISIVRRRSICQSSDDAATIDSAKRIGDSSHYWCCTGEQKVTSPPFHHSSLLLFQGVQVKARVDDEMVGMWKKEEELRVERRIKDFGLSIYLYSIDSVIL